MDLIDHTMRRIKGTIMMINAAFINDVEVGTSDNAISECLWGVHGQLEQLEKLIKFEAKE